MDSEINRGEWEEWLWMFEKRVYAILCHLRIVTNRKRDLTGTHTTCDTRLTNILYFLDVKLSRFRRGNEWNAAWLTSRQWKLEIPMEFGFFSFCFIVCISVSKHHIFTLFRSQTLRALRLPAVTIILLSTLSLIFHRSQSIAMDERTNENSDCRHSVVVLIRFLLVVITIMLVIVIVHCRSENAHVCACKGDDNVLWYFSFSPNQSQYVMGHRK